MSSNKMNKAEVDGKYLRSGKTMQSLKWFFIAVSVVLEMLKIQWDRWECLEKLSHASENFSDFLKKISFLSVAHNMQVDDGKWDGEKGLGNYQISSLFVLPIVGWVWKELHVTCEWEREWFVICLNVCWKHLVQNE